MMKTTAKKNLIIFHRPQEWAELSERLRNEYGPSVMISFTCKRKLGFTVRYHKGLVQHDTENWKITKDQGWQHQYHYEDQVHLDFYDTAQQSWFMLKYLNL